MCKERIGSIQGTVASTRELLLRKGLRAKRGRKSTKELASLNLLAEKDFGPGCAKPKK